MTLPHTEKSAPNNPNIIAVLAAVALPSIFGLSGCSREIEPLALPANSTKALEETGSPLRDWKSLSSEQKIQALFEARQDFKDWIAAHGKPVIGQISGNRYQIHGEIPDSPHSFNCVMMDKNLSSTQETLTKLQAQGFTLENILSGPPSSSPKNFTTSVSLWNSWGNDINLVGGVTYSGDGTTALEAFNQKTAPFRSGLKELDLNRNALTPRDEQRLDELINWAEQTKVVFKFWSLNGDVTIQRFKGSKDLSVSCDVPTGVRTLTRIQEWAETLY